MKFVLYNLTLNLKWFCSKYWRCVIAGSTVVLPFVFLDLINVRGDFYLLKFTLGSPLLMIILFSVPFKLIGIGLSEFHPNLDWKDQENRIVSSMISILLLFPILIWVVKLITYGYQVPLETVSFSLSLLSVLLLYLIHRQPTNEILQLPINKPNMITSDNITAKQLRRIRMTIIVFGLSNLVLIFLFIKTKIDAKANESLIRELEYRIIGEDRLHARIDSLTQVLESTKLQMADSVSNHL